MADFFPTAGCRFYIGPAMDAQAADFDVDDFETSPPKTWTECDGWRNMGSLGDAGALITVPLINRSRDAKQKGTANAGSMQNSFVRIDDDPGQILLRAAGAASNKNNYAFKVVYNDGDDSVSPVINPSISYFVGLVMGSQNAGGDANTPRTLEANVEVNSNVVDVPAGV